MRRLENVIMPRRNKDLAPMNGLRGVLGGSVTDVQLDWTSLPGDPPITGGSSPTSVSDTMVVTPVQKLAWDKYNLLII